MTQRLFLLSFETIFAARVNQQSFVYPMSQVAFDTVTTGNFSFIKPGMTVLFGTSAGADDLGRQRIRAAATSSVIYFGRSSRNVEDGAVDLEDNAYITVVDDYRVWAKIPYIDDDGVVYKDETAYTDQTSNPPPKANIGGGWRASKIDSGTNVATFQFPGTGSYPVAAGATISTYLWDVDDGTITVGTSASSTITATFPAGRRWVSLTVTDSNGETHTMRVLVYAYDPDSDGCVAHQCVDHRITQQGQFCSFRILEDIAIGTYPDGMAVLFWEGEPSSASDYSNVKFWGWHQSDQNSAVAERTGTLRDTTLNCLDVAGRLDTLPGFSASVTRDASPANWLEMAGLNMDLYIDYLLRWHSTALENAYYTPSGTGSNYPMVIIASDGESLLDQVSRMARAIVPDYVLTYNRNGEFNVLSDPILQETADRTATSQATIGASNWIGVNWERIRPPRVHWNRGEAIKASATEISALFNVAAGTAPGQGLNSVTTGYQLAQSQEDLNACEGHRYARMNARNLLFPVQLATDGGIDPADMTWITLNVPDAYTRRAIGFSSARCLPIEVVVSYEYSNTGMTRRVEVMLEEETSGTPAVTYIPPNPDYEPPIDPPIEPPPPPPTTQGDGFGTVTILTEDVDSLTRDFSQVNPAYIDVGPSSGGGIFYDFILDPHDPTNTAFTVSTAGVYKTTNYSNSSPTWNLVLSKATIEAGAGTGTYVRPYKILGSINQQDYFIVFYSRSTAIHCAYTTNGGTSWTTVASWHDGTAAWRGAVDIVPHLVGGNLVLYMWIQGPGAANTIILYKSTDGGASWSSAKSLDIGTNDAVFCYTVHCPYNDNADGNLVWVAHGDGGAGVAARRGIYKTTNGGADLAEVVDVNVNVKRWAVETWTQDQDIVYYWTAANELFVSTNGGSSFTEKDCTGLSGNIFATGGFPFNSSYYYVLTDTGIFVSIDGGDNFIDKTGDWSWDAPVARGQAAIVPNWKAE